jgi:hypothetical protein
MNDREMAHFVFYDLPPEAKKQAARLRSEIAGNEMLLACYRLEAVLAKANFNRNQERVPAGSGTESGRWTRIGGGASGEKPVMLAQNEEDENPRRTPLEELLDPTAEVRTEAFHGTLRSIRRLEPNNRQ